jgi:hypothetical protein
MWHLGLVFLCFHVFLFFFGKCFTGSSSRYTGGGWGRHLPAPSSRDSSPSSPGSKEQIFKIAAINSSEHFQRFSDRVSASQETKKYGGPVKDLGFMYCSGVGVTGGEDGWQRKPDGGVRLPAVSQIPGAAAAAVVGDWRMQQDPPWRPTVLEISSAGQRKVSRSQTFSEGPLLPHKG